MMMVVLNVRMGPAIVMMVYGDGLLCCRTHPAMRMMLLAEGTCWVFGSCWIDAVAGMGWFARPAKAFFSFFFFLLVLESRIFVCGFFCSVSLSFVLY